MFLKFLTQHSIDLSTHLIFWIKLYGEEGVDAERGWKEIGRERGRRVFLRTETWPVFLPILSAVEIYEIVLLLYMDVFFYVAQITWIVQRFFLDCTREMVSYFIILFFCTGLAQNFNALFRKIFCGGFFLQVSLLLKFSYVFTRVSSYPRRARYA